MKVAIAADGAIERVIVLRASAAKLGEFVAGYVKSKWRFMAPKNDAGKATRVEYLQAFNYEFTVPEAVALPAAVAPPAPALVARESPAPAPEDTTFVRDTSADNGDIVADLPTAGAMKLEQQVLIDPKVLKVLVDSKPAFRNCGEGEGVVKTSFVIGESGSVARAHVRSSTLDDDKVERCVLSTLSKLTFPKPRRGEPMLVLYPIVFR